MSVPELGGLPDLARLHERDDAPVEESSIRQTVRLLLGRGGDPCWCQAGILGWLVCCELCVDPENRMLMFESLVALALEERAAFEVRGQQAALQALAAAGLGGGVTYERGRRRGRREDRRVELRAVTIGGSDDG